MAGDRVTTKQNKDRNTLAKKIRAYGIRRA